MLTSISVENFKAFQTEQILSLSQLTLLFGPNSAGKSSFLQALQLLKHGFRTGNFTGVHLESGLDLGGFTNYVHGQQADGKVSLSLAVELPAQNESLDLPNEGAEPPPLIYCLKLELSRPSGTVEVTRLEYTYKSRDGTDHPLVTFGTTPNLPGQLMLQRVNLMAPLFAASWQDFNTRIQTHFGPALPERIQKWLERDFPFEEFGRREFSGAQLFDEAVRTLLVRNSVSGNVPFERIPRHRLGLLLWARGSDHTLSKVLRYEHLVREWGDERDLGMLKWLTSVPRSRFTDIRNEPLQVSDSEIPHLEHARHWNALLSTLRRVPQRVFDFAVQQQSLFTRTLDGVQTLGGLRQLPERGMEVFDQEGWGANTPGRSSWSKLQSRNVRVRVNQALEKLGMNYSLQLRTLVDKRDLDEILNHHPQYSTEKLVREVRALAASRSELVLEQSGGLRVSLRDVGLGVSQVVPILIEAFTADAESLLIIEQPELHLHPRLQATLADVLLEASNRTGGRLLLETHSEDLLLRVLRRVREGVADMSEHPLVELAKDELDIYFVQPREKGSRLLRLALDEAGDFADVWPEGFLADRARDLG